ncbi:hypothetical protein FQR65_LT01402 [Abscondita terminalis]|nr:hypothetical protein FQR65_LT01402 [Abscondita terminalis]
MNKITVVFALLFKLSISSHFLHHHDQHQSLIIGGKASRYQFPYQISLQKSVGGSDYIHICSGAILSLTWVATTAYCVTPPDANIRVVAGILNKKIYDFDVQVAAVERILVHPDYTGGLSHSDFALLQLEEALFFTKSVQPIPPNVEDDTWGASLLSSWKVQTQLQKSYTFANLYYMLVYVSTDDDCKRILSNAYNISEKVLCTEKMDESLFCPGESGSPLVSNGYLIGLTSWGFVPCGVTIHTKISHFLQFIASYVTVQEVENLSAKMQLEAIEMLRAAVETKVANPCEVLSDYFVEEYGPGRWNCVDFNGYKIYSNKKIILKVGFRSYLLFA